MQRTGRSVSSTAGSWVFAVSCILVLFLTLTPQTGRVDGQTYGLSTTDVLLNVWLFFPLGVGLALLGFRPWRVALLGGMASICIELAQYLWIPGRDGSAHDVVANLTGALLGALVLWHWGSRKRWWRWIGSLLSGIIGLVSVLGGRLARPVAIPTGPLYAQWQHQLGGRDRFHGRVLTFSYQGFPLPDGIFDETGKLRERIAASDSIVLTISVITGPPSRYESQIAGIVAGRPGPHLINVLEKERQLIVRPRLTLSTLGLGSPAVAVPDALTDRQGDTVHITITTTRKAIRVVVDGRGQRSARLRLSGDLAWLGFSPADRILPGDSAPWWVRAFSCAGAFLILGLASANRRWVQSLVLVGWMVSGPLLFAVAPIPLGVVASGFLGTELGHRLGRLLGLI